MGLILDSSVLVAAERQGQNATGLEAIAPRIGNVEIAFTNSALFMLIGLLATAALMLIPTRQRALVPGRRG